MLTVPQFHARRNAREKITTWWGSWGSWGSCGLKYDRPSDKNKFVAKGTRFKRKSCSQEDAMGPVSRKSRKLFRPEKPFLKLRPPYSVKLFFSSIVKGIKIKITAKFRDSRRLRFEDTKSIMTPEMRPKSFGTFEKQAPGLSYLE